MVTTKDIDAKVAAYRSKLESEGVQPRPKPSPAERAAKILERLGTTEVLLAKTDIRRITLLLRAAKLALDKQDYGLVHGYAAEIQELSRVRVLGVLEAHPVLPAAPVEGLRALLSSLPPPVREGHEPH